MTSSTPGLGRLDGKVAIVTGGASGIGQASSELFAREGAAVVIADLDEARSKEVAAGIVSAGGRALAQPTDIGDPADIEALVAATIREFGALHVLFNNAADTSVAMLERDGLVVDMELEVWDHALAVDLRGAMLCSKHAIPHMKAAGGGSIINTSSNQSLAGDLTQSAYGIAKAGINQLTRYLATQCGRDGIRCNAVSPGLILTPAAARACPPEMQEAIAQHSPLGRCGVPDDLARAALFLASDESSYVSGQILSIDGGQLAPMPHYAHLMQSGETTTVQKPR